VSKWEYDIVNCWTLPYHIVFELNNISKRDYHNIYKYKYINDLMFVYIYILKNCLYFIFNVYNKNIIK